MPKSRVKITMEFYADLDMVPGWGDNAQDWINLIRKQFEQQTHYNTSTEVVSIEERPYRWDDEKECWITPVFDTKATNPLEGMTQEKWDLFTESEKRALRSDANLTPQLIGLEGHRVEVVDIFGETRRFIVSRSSGWIPCHIEIKKRTSVGGVSADQEYRSVKVVERNVR